MAMKNRPNVIPFLIVSFLFLVLFFVFGFLSTRKSPNLNDDLNILVPRIFNNSCSDCLITADSFKEMICNKDKFVLIIVIDDVGSELRDGSQWLLVTRRTTLKSFHRLSPEEVNSISQLEILPRNSNCSVTDLKVNSHYLITGNITTSDDSNHRHLVIGQCDIITLWSGLDGSYQEDWIMFFRIKNCPYG